MNTSVAAPKENGDEKRESIAKINAPDVQTIDPEMNVFDLYAMRPSPEKTIQPFIHQINIKAESGEVVRVRANFDDRALANAMSTTKFNEIKHRLGHYGGYGYSDDEGSRAYAQARTTQSECAQR